MRIRRYEKRDFDDVRGVCAANSSSFDESSRGELWTLYCDYYLEREPELCFVLADSGDRAVGYVCGSEDWKTYEELYAKHYTEKLGDRYLERKLAEDAETEFFSAQYPAHLHIDILEGSRGAGFGTKLLERLVKELGSRGAAGVMLSVRASNHAARRFYERFGFTLLSESGGSAFYGLKIRQRQEGF